MNVQELCAFGAADVAKLSRLIKLAEREGAVVVGVQETWFKKRRYDKEIERALRMAVVWEFTIKTKEKRRAPQTSSATIPTCISTHNTHNTKRTRWQRA